MGSLAQQIAPLSSGSIDVACGAISAGLYNAISRDIPMKVVADKGRNAPGYAYNSILVRKDLIDSGAVKTLADMKGRTLATIDIAVKNFDRNPQRIIFGGGQPATPAPAAPAGQPQRRAQ